VTCYVGHADGEDTGVALALALAVGDALAVARGLGQGSVVDTAVLGTIPPFPHPGMARKIESVQHASHRKRLTKRPFGALRVFSGSSGLCR